MSPPEVDGGADWADGKLKGRLWASDVAKPSELQDLDGLRRFNPSEVRMSRCLNIAKVLDLTDAAGWPTLRSWLPETIPTQAWLAGFVDGALKVLEEGTA
jgi:hypothetical protein